MREALILHKGKTLCVDLATYLHLREYHPEVNENKPCCPACGAKVYAWDKKGAKGFRTARVEVTVRNGQVIAPQPGFHHYPKDPTAKDCPLSFSNDPRYAGIHSENHFYIEEKARNVAALSNEETCTAIHKVQDFLVKQMLGESVVPQDIRDALNSWEHKLLTMGGLASYRWVMAYMPLVMLGPIERQMGEGEKAYMRRVEYHRKGVQRLPYRGVDEIDRYMVVPEYLELSFSRKDGKEPYAMLSPGKDFEPKSFEVSRKFAVGVVRDEPKRIAQEAADRQRRAKAEAKARFRENQLKLEFI